jgi:hypothetical protein
MRDEQIISESPSGMLLISLLQDERAAFSHALTWEISV